MSDNKELGAGPLANEGTKGLPVVAEPCIECWSCHVPVTLNERAECDGECPHCASELDLDDYLGTAVMALAELRQSIEGTTGYKYRAELYDEVWQAARDRGFANVVGALAALDALQAELAAMREQKPVAWIREPDADGMAIDWYPGDLAGLPIGTKLYAGPVSASIQVSAEREAFEVAYARAVDTGWNSVKDLAEQIWEARANVPAPSQVAAEVVQVPRTDAESLIKAADVLIAKADGFSVSGVYFNEFDHNSVALITLGLEMDTLRALLATSQEKA